MFYYQLMSLERQEISYTRRGKLFVVVVVNEENIEILGWPKVYLGSHISYYRRTQMNFLTNPLKQCQTKKKRKERNEVIQAELPSE